MAVVDGQKVNAAVSNAAFVSRLKDSNTVGRIDLEETISTESGPSVFNVQREHNSIASFVGKSINALSNAVPSWASNIVGGIGEPIKQRVDALVALFFGTEGIGHVHDGTDGQAPKIRYTNLLTVQANNPSTGNIDALPTANLFTVRLTGLSAVTLRGITDAAEGRVVTVMNTTGFTLVVSNDDANPLISEKIITGTGDDLELQDGAAATFQYDATSLVWRAVSGAGGKNTVGYQECPATITPLTVYGPLTFTPVNTESIIVFVDGLKRELNVEWTYDDLLKEITFINPLNIAQDLCVYYLFQSTGTTVTIAGSGTTNKVDKRILSAGDITAKKVTLSQSPTSTTEVVLDIIGGTAQSNGTDFSVTGNELSWSGLNLDGLLSAGDELRIFYWY